jgi:hypothetical protein
VKLWYYLRQVLSGLAVTYTAAIFGSDTACGAVIALSRRPVTHRNLLHALLFLLAFAAFSTLSWFLYKRLFRDAELAWWTAMIGCFAFSPQLHPDFLVRHSLSGGNSQSVHCVGNDFCTLLYFLTLSLPASRRYCGVRHA